MQGVALDHAVVFDDHLFPYIFLRSGSCILRICGICDSAEENNHHHHNH